MALPANWVWVVVGVEGSKREREKRVDFPLVTGSDFQSALWQKGLTLYMPERSGPHQA
jgi:hypothetical protein